MPKIVAHKKDWLKLGYKLFSKEGERGIVVESMAKKLNCNKSSFYWHFKSKPEFINEIVAFWVETDTNSIIDEVEKQKTAQKKYDKFIELVFQYDPYLEFIFHLKRYAKKHEEIEGIIDEVDRKRLNFTASFFQEQGYSKKESEMIASIFYKYLIGYHERYRNKPPNENYQKEVKKELMYILNKDH